MNEFERNRKVYQYFTLREWKLLAYCVQNMTLLEEIVIDDDPVSEQEVSTMLTKFPSASL